MSDKQRMARCTYFGARLVRVIRSFKCGCDKCKEIEVCKCEMPSSNKLAFFREHPEREYDEYFCGCMGWD